VLLLHWVYTIAGTDSNLVGGYHDAGDSDRNAYQLMMPIVLMTTYVDHLGFYQMDEFTVYQSLVFPAAIYPVLSQGGRWVSTTDPFVRQLK